MPINSLPTTLNNIIQIFSVIAAEHKLINSFGYGPISELAVDKAPAYPLLWVEPQPSMIKTNLFNLSFKLFLVDLIQEDASNRYDVHSDTFQTLADIKAFIRKNLYWDTVNIIEDSYMEPLFEKFDDYTEGWVMTINLQVEWEADVCHIPGLFISGATYDGGYITTQQFYLPLAGGTLTGPLIGTDATFDNYYSGNTNLLDVMAQNDKYIVSGTNQGYLLRYRRSDGQDIDVSLSSFTVQLSADTFTTGATFVNNTLNFITSGGISYSVTVDNFTGITIHGLAKSDIVSATTISADTYYGDGSHLTGLVTAQYWTSGSTGVESLKQNNGVAATDATANYAIAMGYGTKATGQYSYAEGVYTTASGFISHAEGATTKAPGAHSHAEGNSSIASGDTAHAEGTSTTAIGDSSHSEGNNTVALGVYSHSEGLATIASGSTSHAEGQSTQAIGDYSHAEGVNSIASGLTSHAEGSNTAALGDYSHTEGYGTTASGTYGAHAEGASSEARGTSSHAEGGSIAQGDASHSEGNNTTAVGNYSHSEGRLSTANGDASHAEGINTFTTTDYSHAEGNATTAIGSTTHTEGILTVAVGDYSHAEGQQTTASGQSSHSEGSVTYAIGINSHSEGNGTTASGSSSHAEGQTTIASGNNSHSEGNNTIASGIHSHSEGDSTQAQGNATHTEGYGTVAIGDYAHAEGVNSTASGLYAHAEGEATTSTGEASHSEGVLTMALYDYSHAEGQQTTTLGQASHAEGTSTIAIGNMAHAEGWTSTAVGNVSHAEGQNTVASGSVSHSEGLGTTASGPNSHSQGDGTIASGSDSHAGGYKSVASGNYSFAHGSGVTASGIGTVVFGANLTGSSDNTVYVPYLNINKIYSGTSILNLGLDANGNVVTGTTGGSTFTGGTVSGSTNFTNGLTANTMSATTYYGDGSHLSGISSANYFTTAATLSNSIITYNRNDGLTYNVNLSGITGLVNYLPITGGTMTGTLIAPTISSTTISANTILSAGTNLTSIFTTPAQSNAAYVYKSGDTMTGALVINSTLNVTGATTANTLSLNSFTAVTENIVTTSGTSQLQDYLQVDSAFITDSTLITAIINPINWSNGSYTGTTTGAIEGSAYNGINYKYEYQNSMFNRYLFADYPATTYTGTTTAVTVTAKNIYLNITNSGQTITLPQASTMAFENIYIKNIGTSAATISATTSLIDGSGSTALSSMGNLNLKVYNNNYYKF